jgi:hypothetical protein
MSQKYYKNTKFVIDCPMFNDLFRQEVEISDTNLLG